MIDGKIIKVCGMREAENIRSVEGIEGIDMIGFIFYEKSTRFVHEVPTYLPINTHRVGVFVNEIKSTVSTYANRFGLDYVQLHGNESPVYCQSLHNDGLKIIKAFSIAHPKDLDNVSAYEKYCHFFLFDTPCEGHGGSGTSFDWTVLHTYKGNVPFLLSGGISSCSVQSLKEFEHPLLKGYDLNSRFELKPALKDPEQIHTFLKELAS